MRFLVDAQLPPALAALLRDYGHTAEHVTDIGPGDTPDRELWNYALKHDAAIVTKDGDFAKLLALRLTAPAVVWVRLPNTRRTALLVWFAPMIEKIVESVEGGQKLVELR